MRKFLASFATLLVASVCAFGQGTQPIRTPLTTNQMMNVPTDLMVPFWNAIAGKWSNAVPSAATVTNLPPYLTTPTLTNLAGTGIAPGATNASAYIGSSSGAGTNTDIKVTLEVFGSAFVATNLNVTNGITSYGGITSVGLTPGITSDGGGGFNITGGGSFTSSGFSNGDRVLGTGVGPNASIEETSVTTTELGYLTGVTSSLQPQINNRIANLDGRGTNTAFFVNTNVGAQYWGGSGGTQVYSYDNSGTPQYRLILSSGSSILEWGTNNHTHGFRGTSVYPSTDGFTSLGDATHRWHNAFLGETVKTDGTNGARGRFHATTYSGTPGQYSDLFLQTANGTEAAPTEILSGNTIGKLSFYGEGASGNTLAFGIEPQALADFTTPGRSPTVASFEIGRANASGTRQAMALTAFHKTNQVDVINNSNVVTVGTTKLIGGVTADSTNMVNLLSEDATPAPGAYVMIEDVATATLLKTPVSALTGGGIAIQNGAGNGNVFTNLTLIGSSHVISGFGGDFLYVDGLEELSVGTFGSGLSFDSGTGIVTATGSGGGGPGTLPMNSNQFDTNDPVTIKNGALLTNTSVRTALTLPTLTASRAALINGSNQLTNSANVTDTELEFLDGVTSSIQTQLSNDVRVVAGTGGITVTPSGSGGIMTYTVNDDDAGGGGSTNNVVTGQHFLSVSNQLYRAPMNLGDTTNIVASFRTNQYIVAPSSTFTVTFTDLPQSGHKATIELYLINTNTSAGYFQTNGLNGGSVILLSAPSTNRFLIHSQTNALWVESGQILATGLSDIFVMATNPVVHGSTNIGLTVQGDANLQNAKWAIFTNYVNTVSNFVFSFSTNRYELKNQTNAIFTNIVEEATAVGADMSVHIHNTTGVTMGLVWPAYGAQHGYYFQTNANNPIISTTTLAAGAHGVASFTAYGTNIFATFTTWP